MPRIHLPREQPNPCPLHHPDPCRCNPIDLSPEAALDRDRVRLRESAEQLDEAARQAFFTGEPVFGRRGPQAQAALYQQQMGNASIALTQEAMTEGLRQMARMLAPPPIMRQEINGDWVVVPPEGREAAERILDQMPMPETTRQLHRATSRVSVLERRQEMILEAAKRLNQLLDKPVPATGRGPADVLLVLNQAMEELQTWKRRAQQRRLEKKDKW